MPYKANQSFYTTDEDGNVKFIKKGTRYADDHSILEGRDDLFEKDESPEAEKEEQQAVKRGPGRPRKEA